MHAQLSANHIAITGSWSEKKPIIKNGVVRKLRAETLYIIYVRQASGSGVVPVAVVAYFVLLILLLHILITLTVKRYSMMWIGDN